MCRHETDSVAIRRQDVKYDTERDFGKIWQDMATYGNLWKLMTTYGNIQQFLHLIFNT